MDLVSLESNFSTWVETVSGLTLHWRRYPPKALQFPFIEAELLTIRGKGHDEKFFDYDEPTDSNISTLSGIRAATLTLHFLSLKQQLSNSAREYAEYFRTKMYGIPSLAMLADANLALVEMLSLIDTDFEDRSGRLVSQVSVDLLFELRSSLSDASYAGDYIKKVDLTLGGYVVDDYGNPVLDENGDYIAAETTDTITVPG